MPDLRPADDHEEFINDMIEIDRAYAAGRLREWIEEKLADDRNTAGFDNDNS